MLLIEIQSILFHTACDEINGRIFIKKIFSFLRFLCNVLKRKVEGGVVNYKKSLTFPFGRLILFCANTFVLWIFVSVALKLIALKKFSLVILS